MKTRLGPGPAFNVQLQAEPLCLFVFGDGGGPYKARGTLALTCQVCTTTPWSRSLPCILKTCKWEKRWYEGDFCVFGATPTQWCSGFLLLKNHPWKCSVSWLWGLSQGQDRAKQSPDLTPGLFLWFFLSFCGPPTIRVSLQNPQFLSLSLSASCSH